MERPDERCAFALRRECSAFGAGRVAEWFKAAVLKTARPNPAKPLEIRNFL
jgi:hypothetical protein